MFDMTQPQCNEWIHCLSDILVRILKTLGELPDRNHLRVKYQAEKCNNILLDRTERPIERPQDSDWQKSVYSGKKTHNLKNNLLCTANKRIIWLSQTYNSSIHDKKIVEEQPLSLPMNITIWQDISFLGRKPVNATVMMPTKKPKGKLLTYTQKDENRKISNFRIIVKHAIGGVKKYRIVKEQFRCCKFGFDNLVMLIACDLLNFRITSSLTFNHI